MFVIIARVIGALVAAILLAVAAAFGSFAWDRWFRYDDAADFVGVWLAEGGTNSIAVTSDTFELADDAAVSYTIDPFAKTISYSLGSLEGSGRYRFSADRTRLAIIDGQGGSWIETLGDDMVYALQCLWASVTDEEAPALADGDDAIILDREPASLGSEEDGQALGDAAADAADDEASSSEGDATAAGSDDAAGSAAETSDSSEAVGL